MPGTIGQDELPGRGREVAVRDINRDALLALSTQAVREQRKIGSIQALTPTHLLNMIKSVNQNRVGVEEQPTDQGRFAVVD